jgi:uncharacterized protein (DUF58 family)
MKQAHLVPEPVSAPARQTKRLGFGFGRRFFLMTLLGLLWVAPAFWDLRYLLVMAVWDVFALAAWAVDMWRLPRPESLSVTRSWADAPSLSNDQTISLEVHNRGGALECSLVDDVPESLRREPPRLKISVPGNSSATVSYTVRPLQRGDVKLGDVYLRYWSGANFAERWARAGLQQSIQVFPDLEEARRHNIYLIRARQIELERRLLRQRGTGREFESLREYQQGDEFRNICWSATARRGKHVSKLYQVERSQAVWLVLDAGRLLRTRVQELNKLDLSVNAALSLAQIALYSGDRVGLMVYGRQIQQRVGLGRGLGHMRVILERLAAAHEEAAEADHLRAAAALMQMQRQRGLIIWITDLADTSMTPEVIESASQILSRHLLLFVVIAQKDLLALAAHYPKNAAEMFEVTAAQELVHRRETLIARVRNRGALALEVSPDHLTTSVINQYLKVKERNLI